MFYNLLDRMTHVWLYPLLRFARSAAFTVARPEAMRAILFVQMSLLTACSFDLSVLFTCSALTLRPGNVLKARRDVCAGFNSAGRLERSSRHATTQRRDRDPASPCETAG
jgi:hypothetical protein